MENTMDEKTQEEVTEEVKMAQESNADEDTVSDDNVEVLETAAQEDSSEEEQKEQKDEFKEKYYYLAAEMQNMQRRYEREKDDLHKFGSEKIMKDLVAVMDNFERTLGFIEKEEDEKIKNIAEGIRMVNKLFLDTLEKHGLKKIEALGEEFDPNFHEALAQQPAEGKKDMEVIQVFENGYTLNDRVVRAAKVIVAKN
ncbi:MAG: nucleotide exchange factor GrpE [Halobacteriovoraceae bacterium]|nr:nucleotide exchange factor GrpE [Halobacteriovoraceae bacterium]|tara:strand:- start:2568 stop:3158 length:591 start_codon:yes stop_codon:yes gene_type:complete